MRASLTVTTGYVETALKAYNQLKRNSGRSFFVSHPEEQKTVTGNKVTNRNCVKVIGDAYAINKQIPQLTSMGCDVNYSIFDERR